jgi:hypothetical protein
VADDLMLPVTHPSMCDTCGEPSTEYDVLRLDRHWRIWDDARYGGCANCRRTWRTATTLERTSR